MGYAFTFEQPASDGSFGLNNWQMGFVREAMREAGAAAGQGLGQALRAPGLEPTDRTVAMDKFLSNSNWHVSAAEAEFIAARLRLAINEHVVSDLLSFFDDAPEEAAQWVSDFADFNERSVAHDGYRVR
ncbi:hypothetical protein E2C00_01815 [Streptomyces sp. WAC05374]|uniref:hypothetical protein n=1 Tax=Streptomyces sp. WAC05374 TaxID=2487420 RepID=UPI000F87E595|nr:hypothetical protein [Streptomyces sp. WAC05374]RST12607.1 hypothetical protein EF905_22325 [Streptomyces sp. WAC05374]TDF50270.1 hypothetical protein E2B92_01790 [Streptomyces sp. WAC05374]TDF57994.1 hypothetical protein E2C02_09580 [Streptomyces sp. WAC05374]TDF60523.1 hypothetical protein E2C00_01815 [Streptomyces sp. WAC05374]